MTTLQADQRVSYDIENDQRGKSSAVNLQAV
jgi:CspA family cold shock protein